LDKHKEILNLLAAYLNNQVTREEFDRLFADLSNLEDADFEKAILQALDEDPNGFDADFIQERVSSLYPQIQANTTLNPLKKESTDVAKQSRQIQWRIVATAAAVIAIVLLSSLYFFRNRPHQNRQARITTPENILPGGNRATLMLGDGRSIDLSAEKNGIVVVDGIKYADGSVVMNEQIDHTTIEQAQLRTPKGGQYEITLPDGTRVWLNAASTLTYPTKFSGYAREVTLEGEAYFDVMKHPEKPFIVNTAKQRVEVLGTTFNINAYSNEVATKTTLLTGSIRVNRIAKDEMTGHSQVLAPYQQSTIRDNQQEITINKVDPQSAIAWKNGLFNFHGLSIDESLKQVERWYDIRIVYQGKKPTGYLGGKMSRGVKLATFLNFLAKDFQIKSEMKADRTVILTTSE